MEDMIYNNSIINNKKIIQKENNNYVQYKYENIYNPRIDKEIAKKKRTKNKN